MKDITFKASKHTEEALKRLQEDFGMNRSQVIILAIERLLISQHPEYLKVYPDAQEKTIKVKFITE